MTPSPLTLFGPSSTVAPVSDGALTPNRKRKPKSSPVGAEIGSSLESEKPLAIGVTRISPGAICCAVGPGKFSTENPKKFSVPTLQETAD